MHDVVFVVYHGFQQLDASGPASVFQGANRELKRAGRAAHYRITLASAQGGSVESSSGISVQTCKPGALARRPIGSLLVTGADREDLLPAMADPVLKRALRRWNRRAERIGSVCSGAFLLAGCGLLDGHRVTTHWDACTPLARAFPAVTVDAQALFIQDGRLWTSAGVTTGIDMALALVAMDLGPAIAAEVARRLILYARRPGHQSQFSALLQAQARADDPFGELIAWIQDHLTARLDIPSLAGRAAMSERSFHRRFVAETGETPARFVEALRLDAARLLLSRGAASKVVAARVGLFPVARLNEAFERRFGISPRLFRDMHGEPAATPAPFPGGSKPETSPFEPGGNKPL